MTEPLIGVGVPVWRGAAFVARTLQSVLDQRGVRLQIVVSIDGADPDSERACRPFASDSRVRIVVQPGRLGWVKNTAAVLAAAGDGVDFVCVQPHDDWVEPDYLAALFDVARDCPRAAVVFSDLVAFGIMHGVASQDSVIGTPMERQLSLLTSHFNAIPYRGLTRTSVLAGLPPMSGNDHGDFACDTVWMARLARAGDLIRVPKPLYHKRYDANTAHAEWTNWPMERKVAAWTRHCLDMLAEALTVAIDGVERRALIEAARGRLLLSRVEFGPYAAAIKAMPSHRRWRMRAVFEAAAAARSDIGPLSHTARDRLLRKAGSFFRPP